MSADELINRIRETVPAQLRELPAWLLHDANKTPIYADGANRKGELDSAEDRARLVPFEEAAKALRGVPRACGLGVALGEVPGEEIQLCGIDLDDCYGGNGELDPRAAQVLLAACSYAETSPSGKGLHILGIGDVGTLKVPKSPDAPGLEIYSGGRYFTVTGAQLNGAHLEDVSDAAALARKLLAPIGGSRAEPPIGTTADDAVLAAIKLTGLYQRPGKAGKHLMRCPWEPLHTPNAQGNRNTSVSEAAYFEPGSVIADRVFERGYFKCQHGHCADRGLRELREFLGLTKSDDRGGKEERATKRSPLNWLTLESRTVPDRQWAIEHWFGMGHVTLLAGDAGTGKTTVAQAVCSCLALRREYLDWMSAQRTALLWACEDNEEELWRKQLSVARWLDVPLSAFTGRLQAFSYDGELVELATLVDQRKLVPTAMLTELREQIGDYKADVVALDNIARLYGGNENDRHQVTSFIAMLTAAARPTNAALLLLGHPAKAAGSEYSGSTAWEASVRARWYLGRTLPDADQDEGGAEDDGVRYLCRRKANYSARDWRRLTFQNGVLVPDAPPEPAAGPRAGEEYACDVVARAVRKLASMGEHGVASSNSPKYLPRLARDYKLLERLGEKQFATTMRTMRTDGRLVMKQVGTYSNRTPREALTLPAEGQV